MLESLRGCVALVFFLGVLIGTPTSDSQDEPCAIGTVANLAIGASARAKSIIRGHEARYGCDQNQATYWQSRPGAPEWYRLDLQSTLSIGSVRIYWDTALYAGAFKVQTAASINGAWTDVYTGTGVSGVQDAILPAGTAARYIRIYVTSMPGQGVAIHELEVYPGSATPPPPIPTPSGWKLEYFTNATVSGASTGVEYVTNILKDFTGAAFPGQVTSTTWSLRATQNLPFQAGNYKFTFTNTDDGVKLYVDGVLKVDHWTYTSTQVFNDYVLMTAGNHDIRIEYYNIGNPGHLEFSYVKEDPPPPTPPAGSSGWTATYFNGTNLTSQASTKTFSAPTLYEYYSGAAPAGVTNPDSWSARYISSPTFAAGTYEFTAIVDDGMRVYIDGVILIDRWSDWVSDADMTRKATKVLTAGAHEVKVETYNSGGPGSIDVSWAAVTPPPDASWTGQYYSDTSLTTAIGASFTEAAGALNYDWGTLAPTQLGTQTDTWSARWTCTAQFEAADYTFSVTSDDGVRLYIDNVLVIDKWINQPATTYTYLKTMTAGSHALKVEFYDQGGEAVLKASWSKYTPPAPGSNMGGPNGDIPLRTPGTPVLLNTGVQYNGTQTVGAGQRFIGGKINANGSNVGLYINDGALEVSGVEIYNLGGGYGGGLYFNGYDYKGLKVHDIWIHDGGTDGVNLNRDGDTNGIKNVIMDNILMERMGSDGIHIKGSNRGDGQAPNRQASMENIVLINSKARNCNSINTNGFAIELQDGVLSNWYENNESDKAFSIVGHDNLMLKGNRMTGLDTWGFEIGNVINSTVRDNDGGNTNTGWSNTAFYETGVDGQSPYPGTNFNNTFINNKAKGSSQGFYLNDGHSQTFIDNCFAAGATRYGVNNPTYDTSKDVHTNDHDCP